MQLKIDKIINSGYGLSHYQGKTIFVPGTAEGELVQAEIISDHGDYSVARVVEILTPSPHRIIPECIYYQQCGGCSFQHLSYPEELRIKKEILIDTFNRNGKINLSDFELNLTPSSSRFNYRRKITLQVKKQLDNFEMGFNCFQTNKIISIEKCLLGEERINHLIDKIWKGVKYIDLPEIINSPPPLSGRLSISSFNQGLAVVIKTESEKLKNLFLEVFAPLDEVKSIVWENNRDLNFISGIAKVNPQNVINYEITPTSFFQINQLVADKLLKDLKINFELTKYLYDIYCGAGVISLFLADNFEKVIGIDSDERAVMDAVYNAMLLKKKNIKYYQLNDRAITSKLLKVNSTVILDPPRTGINSALIKLLNYKKVKYLIYISCNPATQARDIKKLISGGYQITKVRGYDMFPLSPYLESVVYLTYCEG